MRPIEGSDWSAPWWLTVRAGDISRYGFDNALGEIRNKIERWQFFSVSETHICIIYLCIKSILGKGKSFPQYSCILQRRHRIKKMRSLHCPFYILALTNICLPPDAGWYRTRLRLHHEEEDGCGLSPAQRGAWMRRCCTRTRWPYHQGGSRITTINRFSRSLNALAVFLIWRKKFRFGPEFSTKIILLTRIQILLGPENLWTKNSWFFKYKLENFCLTLKKWNLKKLKQKQVVLHNFCFDFF